MKKLYSILLLLSFLFLNKDSKGQWVAIPDTNFRNFLTANFPTAMSGSMMDTTNSAITGAYGVVCTAANISDLTGIQYFDALINLDCYNNQLTTLPPLPNTLLYLKCNANQLTSLPTLPPALQSLMCTWNQLTTLPPLPVTINLIYCYHNQINTLPALPSSLQTFYCHENLLGVLPSPLPASLQTLYCYNNHLISLPSFPNSLTYLDCNSNLLSTLPNFSTSSLQYLIAYRNQLTTIPSLPASLLGLNCDTNLLTNLPLFPTGLKVLSCNHNSITIIPAISDSMIQLICSSNQNLNCLSNLKNISYLDITGTGITCLPNRGNLDTSWLSFPICATGNANSCQVYCNSYYSTTYDTLLNTFILTVDTAASNLALSYHWDFGDGTTSTLAAPSHVYTVDTVYNVCLQIHNTAGDSCTYCHTIGKDYLGNIIKSGGFSLNVHNAATGVNDPSTTLRVTEKFEIYPNPASDKITISKEQISINTIQIYDVLGREQNISILNQKSKIVNVSSLPNGIYFVKVTDAAGNYGMKKLVIER